jgi:hypothetical protein
LSGWVEQVHYGPNTHNCSTNQGINIIIKLNKSYITHKKWGNWNFCDSVVLRLLYIIMAYTGEWVEI